MTDKMSMGKHINKTKFIEPSFANKANLIMNSIKKEQNNPCLSFSFFTGENNLFSNLTLEQNFLYQSHIKSIDELYQYPFCRKQHEMINDYILNFRKFYPKDLPSELVKSLSFFTCLLKTTQYGLFITKDVISEDENRFGSVIMNVLADKSFINLEIPNLKNKESLTNKNLILIKKAS